MPANFWLTYEKNALNKNTSNKFLFFVGKGWQKRVGITFLLSILKQELFDGWRPATFFREDGVNVATLLSKICKNVYFNTS